MDIELNKIDILTCDIKSLTSEQSFENDILLPDYYQDIMKILKCSATPVILKTNLSNNKITVDCTVHIKVFYQTIENKIRTISSKVTFTKNFDVDFQSDNSYISPKATLDYVNCRALSERKIDIKGAISIKIKVFNNSKQNILSDAKGSGVQIKTDKIKNTIILGNNNNQFNIKQDILLDNAKPDIGNIIKFDLKPENIDKKIIENKIITKGNLKLKILYAPTNESDETKPKLPISFETELSFSQIIDIPGVNPDDNCDTNIDLIWSEITPKSDPDGRNRLFSVDFSFNISVKCHKLVESEIITDSYSTQTEIDCCTKKINSCNLVDVINEKISLDFNLPLSELTNSEIINSENFKILDIWNEPKIVFSKISNSQAPSSEFLPELLLEGKTEVSILGSILGSDEDSPIYIEKFCDFEKTVPIGFAKNLSSSLSSSLSSNNTNQKNNKNLEFELSILPQNISYNINYDSLDLKIDLLLTGYLYQNNCNNIICEIQINKDSKPKIKQDSNSLIVYYANPGEDIWQLAKKFNTSISAILEENDEIPDQIISEKTMLLIPIIN